MGTIVPIITFNHGEGYLPIKTAKAIQQSGLCFRNCEAAQRRSLNHWWLCWTTGERDGRIWQKTNWFSLNGATEVPRVPFP